MIKIKPLHSSVALISWDIVATYCFGSMGTNLIKLLLPITPRSWRRIVIVFKHIGHVVSGLVVDVCRYRCDNRWFGIAGFITKMHNGGSIFQVRFGIKSSWPMSMTTRLLPLVATKAHYPCHHDVERSYSEYPPTVHCKSRSTVILATNSSLLLWTTCQSTTSPNCPKFGRSSHRSA